MVLDCCVTIASTIISLMMNGICCMYQQSEEQKLREAIRQDIRSECHSMYKQQQQEEDDQNANQAMVVEAPTPVLTPDFGEDNSIDGEESVFIMSSFNFQERRRVTLMKPNGLVRNGLPSILSHMINNDTNLPVSSTSKSAAYFNHDDMRSPFVQVKYQTTNASDESETEADDIDEVDRQLVRASTSWTTISIV
jgi:hypothetical protein